MNTQELLKVNVNDRTEKKNGMTYLSWAYAWTEVSEELTQPPHGR
jgi:hypothetical protein